MEFVEFNDLGLEEISPEVGTFTINDKEIQVKSKINTQQKVDLLEFVVGSVLDSDGRSTPIRVDLFFTLGVVMMYSNIHLPETELIKSPDKIYDILEANRVIEGIIELIDEDEFDFIKSLTLETIRKIENYNSSAAGIIHAMTSDAGDLDEQLQKIIEQINSEEGHKALEEFGNVVKND